MEAALWQTSEWRWGYMQGWSRPRLTTSDWLLRNCTIRPFQHKEFCWCKVSKFTCTRRTRDKCAKKNCNCEKKPCDLVFYPNQTIRNSTLIVMNIEKNMKNVEALFSGFFFLKKTLRRVITKFGTLYKSFKLKNFVEGL